MKAKLLVPAPDLELGEGAMRRWRERYFIFAFIGTLLTAAGLFAVEPEGVRSTTDTVALYLGLGCWFVQIVIWIWAIVRKS